MFPPFCTAARTFVAEVVRLMHATGFPDQDCFQLVLTGTSQELPFPADVRHLSARQLGLRFALLDPLRVANGGVYFAERYGERADVSPVLVHANQNWDKRGRMQRANLWLLDDNAECVN